MGGCLHHHLVSAYAGPDFGQSIESVGGARGCAGDASYRIRDERVAMTISELEVVWVGLVGLRSPLLGMMRALAAVALDA